MGGHLEFPNYFGINASNGDLKHLILFLQKEREKTNEMTLILDVREINKFPTSEHNDFWEIFNAQSKNRLLIIFHNYDEKIGNVIKNKKKAFSISGPLYYDFKLNDGTEITNIEDELILYSVYNMPLSFYQELDGILSLRMYLPDEIEKLPNKLDKSYQKILSSDPSMLFPDPEINLIEEDLDISAFTIKNITYNPFDFKINEITELEISEKTINTTIAEHFNEETIQLIFQKISEVRKNKLHDAIEKIHPSIALKGANNLLVQLSGIREQLKNKILSLTKNIKKEINIINKVKKDADSLIKTQYMQSQDMINQELQEYHSSYKSFIKYFYAFKMNIVIILLILFLLFGLFYFILKLDLEISIPLSMILAIIMPISRWIKLKKKKRNEINELCDDSYSRIVKIIDKEFKKIPRILWNRNLTLLNLKINYIYKEYIEHFIGTLKLITKNFPSDLTMSIFTSNNRLVSFIPTANDVQDFQLDDLPVSIGLDKDELNTYFVEQYFKAFSSLKLGQLNDNIEKSIKDFCDEPDTDLLWESDQIVDFRKTIVQKILFTHPDQFISENIEIKADIIKKFEKGYNNYGMLLLSIFQLKENKYDS